MNFIIYICWVVNYKSDSSDSIKQKVKDSPLPHVYFVYITMVNTFLFIFPEILHVSL